MDAFFASIEQRDNPHYRGKPLIVGGPPKSRGVVCACSYEARRFGVHSAMPCAHAARLCPQAIFVRPRKERYREVSESIMTIFHSFTELVEPLSVDEAFLDVTENSCNEPSATRLAELIRRRIHQRCGLTASAGVSCNKFIAKVASDVNKPDGLTLVPPEEAEAFVAALPIGRFFGVGRVTEQKMLSLGIKTGAHLRQWSIDDLTFHFGRAGEFFYSICRGIDDRPVQPHRARKSIGRELTLRRDIDDLCEIRSILAELATKVGDSLARQQITGSTLTLKLRFDDFTTITRSHTGRLPITGKREINTLLPKLLAAVNLYQKKVRLLGVTVGRLRRKGCSPRQLLLPFIDETVPDDTSATGAASPSLPVLTNQSGENS